jgi:hypothetical protein
MQYWAAIAGLDALLLHDQSGIKLAKIWRWASGLACVALHVGSLCLSSVLYSWGAMTRGMRSRALSHEFVANITTFSWRAIATVTNTWYADSCHPAMQAASPSISARQTADGTPVLSRWCRLLAGSESATSRHRSSTQGDDASKTDCGTKRAAAGILVRALR